MGSLNLAMNLSDIGHCIIVSLDIGHCLIGHWSSDIASLDIDRWEAIRR
ncbi:MAG: hypothetical protein RRB24_04470 [Armatimonadota bacterium]|nr:hypothetical protein [Armatimonadota bacterium]